MRALLTLCLLLLASPGGAQDYPREGEPIPDWQWGIAALFGMPVADVSGVALDLPSYTVRVGYLFSSDVVASDTQLSNDVAAYRADLERALSRSRSTGPAITIEARWTRVAYTASGVDTANHSWLSQQSLNPQSAVSLWAEANAVDQLQLVTWNGGPSAGYATLNSANKLSAISWVSYHQAGSWANYSGAHELLHNWGLHHRRADGAVNTAHPEGYGWTNGTKRTLLAYCCGVREQISNPDVPFLGTTTPSGTPTDNNMAVVARRVAYVSAFRSDAAIPAPPGKPVPTLED